MNTYAKCVRIVIKTQAMGIV